MKIRFCLVALCLLVFYCPAAYGQTAEWEYKQLRNPADQLLNHYAKNGWEIDDAAGGGGDTSWHIVIMKRNRAHPLFGKKTEEKPAPQPPPPAPKPSCKLTLAQAPVIRGLRLGMTSDELFAIFPGNDREEFDRAQKLKSAELPPNYGYANFHFNVSKYATKDRFTGIGLFSFGLFDGKVVSINAHYQNTPYFDDMGQLMEIITTQFNLPAFKDWPDSYVHLTYSSLSCEGFRFKVSRVDNYLSIELTNPTYTKTVEDRRKADLARKREGFKL